MFHQRHSPNIFNIPCEVLDTIIAASEGVGGKVCGLNSMTIYWARRKDSVDFSLRPLAGVKYEIEKQRSKL